MMKTYCIIANSIFASRSEMQDLLDTHPRVSTWYACFAGCVFACSDMSAFELAKTLEDRFGVANGGLFLVVEVGDNRQGRLPKDLWQLFRDPAQVAEK